MDSQRYTVLVMHANLRLIRRIKFQSQNPEYKEVMASRKEGGHDVLEMMQNVVYGPLQLR